MPCRLNWLVIVRRWTFPFFTSSAVVVNRLWNAAMSSSVSGHCLRFVTEFTISVPGLFPVATSRTMYLGSTSPICYSKDAGADHRGFRPLDKCLFRQGFDQRLDVRAINTDRMETFLILVPKGSLNRPDFTGGQNSRRIACYGT